MLYEAVLLFGVVFLAGYLFDTLTQSRDPIPLRTLRQGWLFIAIGAYFIACWRTSGQTLPMKTWHIRVVDRHGASPSLARLLWRYVLLWPLPLAVSAAIGAIARANEYPGTDLLIVIAAPAALFLWTAFDAEAQFLHDRIAGTRLVGATPVSAV